MLQPLLLTGLLLAHALIHIAFVSPAPPATADGPHWPFATERSWLITALRIRPDAVRLLALALVPLTVAAFGLAGVAVLASLPALWAPAIALGSTASLGLLIVFFDPWLVIGIGIDVALLWATLVAGWTPTSTGLG